jgi:hypothetical protein
MWSKAKRDFRLSRWRTRTFWNVTSYSLLETCLTFASWECMPFKSFWLFRPCLRAGRLRGRSSSPGRVKNVLFSKSSRPALGSTQPPIQWVLGALFPGVKRQDREADHSPPDSADVMKMWIYTSTPPICIHSVVLSLLSRGTTLPIPFVKSSPVLLTFIYSRTWL